MKVKINGQELKPGRKLSWVPQTDIPFHLCYHPAFGGQGAGYYLVELKAGGTDLAVWWLPVLSRSNLGVTTESENPTAAAHYMAMLLARRAAKI